MEVLFFIVLPLVAFLYASVGHGGASGYLALMALFTFATQDMRILALTLNLFVAGISFYHFQKEGHFRFKLFYPFIIGSIPAAFIGGMIEMDALWYKRILGIFLLLATLRFTMNKSENADSSRINLILAIGIGAIIGLFSGMIGIGGGIILSPVILLLGWGNMKQTAAVSALFILVNSTLGLAGNYFNDFNLEVNLSTLKFAGIIVLACVGGFLGSIWGSRLKNSITLKYLLAVVLFMASIKLWFL